MLEQAKEKKKKRRIPVHVYVLYLVILTMVFTGVTFSKYVATTTGGDAARTAKYGKVTLNETGDFNDTGKLVILPGVDLKKEALVSMEASETANYLFVKLEVGKEWKQTVSDPYEFSMTDGKIKWSVDQKNWTFLQEDTGAFVFYRWVAPNTKAENINVIKDSMVSVSDQVKRSDLVKLDAQQLDVKFTAMAMQYKGSTAGGTDTEHAMEAWRSMKKK